MFRKSDKKSVQASAFSICLSAGCISLLAGIGVASAQDAMFVDSTGNVGVGTNTPAKIIHAQGASADTLGQNNIMIRMENTTGTQGARRMIELINNGSPLLVYRDTARGTIWNMSPVGNSFAISLTGTGAQEFQLDGAGNLTIQGSLTENSSRAAKDGFMRVHPETLLAKLEKLRITEWSYKHTPDWRHVGPMAEDFHATFGLGPDDRIAPRDLAGVALAAAQALKKENDRLQGELEALQKAQSRNAELEQRVARMEARLEQVSEASE